jgi:hypothetical protein
MELVNTTTTTDPVNMYNYINTFMMNPLVLILLILVVVALYTFTSSSSSPSTSFSGGASSFLLEPLLSSSSSSYPSSSSSSSSSPSFLSSLTSAFTSSSPSSSSSSFSSSSSSSLLDDPSLGNFSILGDSDARKSGSLVGDGGIFGVIIAIVLIFLIVVNALQYFFSINVSAYVDGLFTPKTTVDIVVDDTSYQPSPSPVPEIKFRKQVFNIPGNYYTYDNAKALCAAYGAKLATYDQIESAYNKGAEWCNYGWSANQLALFPTQKTTYDTLQHIKGHENDCGRTGVNGGYIANPNVRFGVNCYGNKPKITSEEDELMKTASPYPETVEDIAFQKKVDIMKSQLDNVLVSPFNHNMWGQI